MDLNEELNEPNPEILRRRCIRHARVVYDRVDSNGRLITPTYKVYSGHNGVINIPDEVKNVLEVFHGDVHDASMHTDFINVPRVQFRQDRIQNKLFINTDGLVTVKYTGYPVDEEDNLIVLDVIYEATLAFAKASEILHRQAKKAQWREVMRPYIEYEKRAERLIAAARAEIFRMTASDWREYNKLRKGGFN